MREAVCLFGLRQLAFRNPFFRCGLMSDDYSSPTQREELLEVARGSAQAWLDLMAAWAQLPAASDLVRWREARLADAYAVAAHQPRDAFQAYEEELPAFRQHREQMMRHVSWLVFSVVVPLSQQIDLEDPVAVQRYKLLAQGIQSFPYCLLQPEIMKLVGSTAEIDLAGLVRQHAVSPWFQQALSHWQSGDLNRAAAYFDEMRSVAPDFALGLFYFAECRIAEKRYDEAYQLLQEAHGYVHPDDELTAKIETSMARVDMARVAKHLERVQRLIERNQGTEAVVTCQQVLVTFPDHPHVLFMLAQAYVTAADVVEAQACLRQAAAAAQPGSELHAAIEKYSTELQQYGPQIILSEAAVEVNRKEWRAALAILAKGDRLAPPNAQITYYIAFCHARLGETQEATRAARLAQL